MYLAHEGAVENLLDHGLNGPESAYLEEALLEILGCLVDGSLTKNLADWNGFSQGLGFGHLAFVLEPEHFLENSNGDCTFPFGFARRLWGGRLGLNGRRNVNT